MRNAELTCKKENNSTQIKPYKNKGVCEKLATDDMTAILDMTINASKRNAGRPSEYPNTPEGMEKFIENTISFFEHVNNINSNPDIERKIIPDIEGWAVYLGITRMTLCTYEHRNKEWGDLIGYYKNAIGCVKKQLAMNYKIPPMVYVFDATNNHGYINSSEFKLKAEMPNQNGADSIEWEMKKKGLVWDDDKGEFVPDENGGSL